VGIADPEEEDGKDLFENWEEACELETNGGVQHPAVEQKDLLGDEDPAELVEKLKIDEDEPQAEEDEAEADDEVMVTPPLKTNGSAVPAEEEDLLA